ncbi:MAG: hypothetical protein JOY96_08395, partial [Verrucomicrobia bacterium]|nr:hypothetical protein [Verrucomicrobiota bacterium]
FAPAHILEPLSRSQAEELAELRLKAFGVADEKVESFVSSAWLNSLFVGSKGPSAREFLQLCQVQWKQKSNEKAEQKTKKSIEEVYAGFVRQRKARPERLAFDADIFRWLVDGPLAAVDNIQCQSVTHRSNDYELFWRQTGRAEIGFGFIREGSHYQWKRIAESAARLALQHGSALAAKLVYFRTPELSAVPKPSWKVNGPVIRAAMERNLHLILLTQKDTAELYAARDFYVEAVAGDIEDYEPEEVFKFLKERLTTWRQRCLDPVNADTVSSPSQEIVLSSELRQDLIELLSNEKFLSLEQAARKLGIAEETVLQLAAQNPSIQKISHPNRVILLWQG